MDALIVSEDSGKRRDILIEYVNDYSVLTREAPEVAAQLSFDAFVQFSLSYYHTREQTETMERLEDLLTAEQPTQSRSASALASQPKSVMKGFIEISAFASRILVATSAIVGVWDRGNKGCRISLNAPMEGFVEKGDRTIIDLQHSYDDIIRLIKEAQ